MAIARDAHNAGDSAGSQASLTFSHTCTGSNLLLIVGVITETTTDVITGVTYNGVAMTRLDARTLSTLPGTVYTYYLLAPATGANNIVISASPNTTIHGRSASYTGVSQTGFPDAHTTGVQTGSTSTTFATTLTTIADNAWAFLVSASDHGAMSSGTNATYLDGGSATNLASYDTNGPKTPAGSLSMTATSSASTSTWATCMLSFAPAGAATATPRLRSLLGVGL